MRNLVIDIGNTFSKVGIFHEKELIVTEILKHLTTDVLADLISQYKVINATVSTVGRGREELVDFLKHRTHYFPFSTEVNPGISNLYASPSTLGLDRWAKIIAAKRCYPEGNYLIIDAGTCITYDLLTERSEYPGGSISLGIGMRFSALNHYTKRLPLVEWDNTQGEIPLGTDTTSAILSGVLQGVLNEVEGFIQLHNKENKEVTVLITGGDAGFLLKQLKNSIFAPQFIHDPYLVLKGLNEVITSEYVQKN